MGSIPFVPYPPISEMNCSSSSLSKQYEMHLLEQLLTQINKSDCKMDWNFEKINNQYLYYPCNATIIWKNIQCKNNQIGLIL